LTETVREAIVTAIVRAENNHNDRPHSWGEDFAVTLCFNHQFDWSNSICVAALASLPAPNGSVQQLVSHAPANRSA